MSDYHIVLGVVLFKRYMKFDNQKKEKMASIR